MTDKKENQETTEVHEGTVVPTGGVVRPKTRNLEDEGVEPQDSKDAMSTCSNGACGMEILKGVIKCPYCNHKQ